MLPFSLFGNGVFNKNYSALCRAEGEGKIKLKDTFKPCKVMGKTTRLTRGPPPGKAVLID